MPELEAAKDDRLKCNSRTMQGARQRAIACEEYVWQGRTYQKFSRTIQSICDRVTKNVNFVEPVSNRPQVKLNERVAKKDEQYGA